MEFAHFAGTFASLTGTAAAQPGTAATRQGTWPRGQGIANPLATIWAGQLMLDFLGEQEAAERLLRTLAIHVLSGQVRTPDLGGSSSTSEVGDHLCAALAQQAT